MQSLERTPGGWLLDAQGERFEFDFLVGADGAVSTVREALMPDFPSFVNSIAAGFFIPASLDRIETKFFGDARGYLWFFPRPDHLSVGLCLWGGDGGEDAQGRRTRERLLDLLRTHFPSLDPDSGKGYGAFIPTITDPRGADGCGSCSPAAAGRRRAGPDLAGRRHAGRRGRRAGRAGRVV